MLSLLFFYDIFFVFGTDVMLTVAKNIDAPIKLLFPRDYSEDPPKMALLGLGDIVLPGVFIAMCLRYDIQKTINKIKAHELIDAGKWEKVHKEFVEKAESAPRPYFWGAILGYLIAIIMTIVVMLIFDHGQPALLYLVPACLLSVIINALRLGEFKSI